MRAMVSFRDRALIDGPARITREGHFVANARVAKANNIQDYMPYELGLAPKADGTPYRIFRPESEIFAKDSLASALHRPIVIDHPKQDVDASNWKTLSVGDTGGEVMRDGESMAIPVMIMDAGGVKAIQTTHPEFSWGYSADLDMAPGKFGDAAYDGSIKGVRYNHLAMCRDARGGHELRIIDERTTPEKPVMKIKIGDAEVDLSDGAAVAVAIGTLNATLADAQTRAATAETAAATHLTTIAAKDAEIATLGTQLAAATLTPEKLRDAAKAYALVAGKAAALGVTVTDAMDEPAIMAAVVTAKMGDAAKDWTDAQIAASFAVLARDAKVEATDTLRAAIIGMPVNMGDAATDYATAREKRQREITDAWKRTASQAA